jgi:hypothetical protein
VDRHEAKFENKTKKGKEMGEGDVEGRKLRGKVANKVRKMDKSQIEIAI